MNVRQAAQSSFRRPGARVWCAVLGLACIAATAQAQTGNPSSKTNPFYGSVTLHAGDR